ncbi:MAG: tetratricopeptide repeat protein [Planctomycetaceae bacterium]
MSDSRSVLRLCLLTALATFVLLVSTVSVPAAVSGSSVSAQAERDPRIGRKVIVTVAGAELKTPQATVWRAYLGEVFTVSITNGEWLWVAEKGGWLWERETVMYDTAIDELSKRLTTTATAENYHLRGVALLAHKQYDRAISDFTESLRREQKNAGAFNNRGQCHYLKGEYQKAIQDYSMALNLDPKHFLARNNRAIAYIAMQQYPNALADLQTALQQVPEYPEALNNRGVVFQKMGKLDDAIRDFTAALKVDPQYTDSLGNRAFTHKLKGDYRNSIADLEQAIKIRPETYEAINDLAWILATCKDDSIRNAPKSLDLALDACQKSEYQQWNTLDTLAAALAENNRMEEARQWLATAIEQAPAEAKPRLKEHMALLDAGKAIRD